MAKYDVTYACGCDGTVQLYGKNSERDRKLDWLGTIDCPKCSKAKHDAEQALLPISMQVKVGAMRDSLGYPIMQIILTGGTINRKDDIKALGYSYTDIDSGVMGMLSMSKPKYAWIKNVTLKVTTGDIKAIQQIVSNDAAALSITDITDTTDKLTNALVFKWIAEADAKMSAASEISKPVRPACHPRTIHGDKCAWNGKYYGGKGTRNYYVANVKHSITDDDYDACMQYRQEIDNYNKKIEEIKSKN